MKTRNYAIEFYRFLFSLAVCVFHFRKYAPPSRTLGFPFDSGYIAVEFFFLLSGIFLAQSAQRKQDLSLREKADASIGYFFQRYRRLYPHYLFTILCMAVIRIFVIKNLTVGKWLSTGISEILMIQSAGTGKQLSFVFWFSSAMIMASFLCYFLRVWNASVCNIFFPFVSVGIYSSLLQKYASFNVTFSFSFLFSDGFWRALAGIMLGCMCYEVIRYLKKYDLTGRKKLFTVIEILLLSTILVLLYLPRYREKNYTLLLLFAAFLVIIFSQTSYLTDLLNNRFSQYLGKISYAVYLNQIPAYTVIFSRFPADENTSMLWATVIYLAIVICLSVFTTWLMDKLQSTTAHRMRISAK